MGETSLMLLILSMAYSSTLKMDSICFSELNGLTA
jgi:hypothetical protein